MRTQKAKAPGRECREGSLSPSLRRLGRVLTWVGGRQTIPTHSAVPGSCSEPRETLNASVLLPDRLLTKVRVVPLVKEELRPDSLHDNVPGIHGAGTAHQCGQNGVGGKHIPLRFCQLPRGQKREKSEV